MSDNHENRPEAATVAEFEFPYLYKFAGQASDEEVLFVTRESKAVLYFRQFVVVVISILLILAGLKVTSFLQTAIKEFPSAGATMFVFGTAAVTLIIGWWFVTTLWKKSIVFVTSKRLKKIIYTTPINKHSLSLPLEMIVDTGSYSKGLLQAILNVGTFTARSSASSSGVATDDTDRTNKKYFYIENVSHVEDLQHYITKLLSMYRRDPESIRTFRPFLPHLKGQQRRDFMQNYPEYWS